MSDDIAPVSAMSSITSRMMPKDNLLQPIAVVEMERTPLLITFCVTILKIKGGQSGGVIAD